MSKTKRTRKDEAAYFISQLSIRQEDVVPAFEAVNLIHGLLNLSGKVGEDWVERLLRSRLCIPVSRVRELAEAWAEQEEAMEDI